MKQWLLQQLDRLWQDMRSTSPVAVVYLMVVVVAALYLVPLFRVDFLWQVFGLGVALVAIGLYRQWLVPVVLLLLMTNLLISEVPIQFGPHHTVSDLATAIATLLLVVAASRYVVLTGSTVRFYRGSWLTRLVTPIKRLWPRSSAVAAEGIGARHAATFRPLEMVSGAIRIVLAVIVSASLLAMFRLNPSAGQWTGVIPTVTRAIEFGVTMLVGVVVIYTIVGVVSWQFLTPSESRMFLRSEVTEEHRADLSRMARQQIKQQTRR